MVSHDPSPLVFRGSKDQYIKKKTGLVSVPSNLHFKYIYAAV